MAFHVDRFSSFIPNTSPDSGVSPALPHNEKAPPLAPDFEMSPEIAGLSSALPRAQENLIGQVQVSPASLSAEGEGLWVADTIPVLATDQALSGLRTPDTSKGFEAHSGLPKEYIEARREVADFIYSDAIRKEGRDAIPDSLIRAVEAFHKQQEITGLGMSYTHQVEELIDLLKKNPSTSMDPAERRRCAEGVAELMELVQDPFLCHGIWMRVELKKPGLSETLLEDLKNYRPQLGR